MPSRRGAFFIVPACLVVALGACKDDRISSYRVVKGSVPGAEMPEAPAMPADSSAPALPPGHPPIDGQAGPMLPPGHPPIDQGGMAASAAPQGDVSWILPRGWKEKPLSEMRVGSFGVPGQEGLEADVSIVVLGGDAGGDLANVNRWRGQLNMQPIRQEDLGRQTESVSPGGRRMLLVDIVTPDLFIDNRYRKRMVAAIYPRGGRTWFFKMTGEDALVRGAKPAFLKFVAGLRFHDHAGR